MEKKDTDPTLSAASPPPPAYAPPVEQKVPLHDAPPPVYNPAPYQMAYTQLPPVQSVIIRQPPLTDGPKDYLVEAILVTVCCFWPLGIVGILKAMEVQRGITLGDRQLAEESSKSAKKFTCIGCWIGVGLYAMMVMFWIAYAVWITTFLSSFDDDEFDHSSSGF